MTINSHIDKNAEEEVADPLKQKYREIFDHHLGKFRTLSPHSLDPHSKKEFFNNVKRDWQNHLNMPKMPELEKSESNGNIGQTILRQLNSLDKRALLALGAKEFVTLVDPVLDKKEYGEGIKFKVKGPKHRGYITILLQDDDTYLVAAFTIYKLEVKVKKIVRHVLVSNLITVIDSIVG